MCCYSTSGGEVRGAEASSPLLVHRTSTKANLEPAGNSNGQGQGYGCVGVLNKTKNHSGPSYLQRANCARLKPVASSYLGST